MFKYNDNELLYLYSWHIEEALNILIAKYSVFIRLKLSRFRIKSAQFEDFYQESLLVLNHAINTFDENKDASFFTYFELLLERRIMRLLSNNKRQTNFILADPQEFDIKDEQNLEQNFYYAKILNSIKSIKMSDLKKQIFNEIFIEEKKVNEFVKEHDLDYKEVYNQIYLLRKKIRKEIM